MDHLIQGYNQQNSPLPVEQNENISQRRAGCGFIIQWTLVNTAGTGLGVTVGLIGASGTVALPLMIMLWGLVGVWVGITQQWILRRQLDLDKWLWATLAGWLLGGILVGRTGIEWGLMGAIIGAMQWLVLKQWVERAGWWVLANAMGLIIGAPLGWTTRFGSRWTFYGGIETIDKQTVEIIDWVVAGIFGGTVAGVITGLWLVWLLSSRKET